ncbi:hypothetical protein, partial [Brucella melitensis]|uniref:hypothetical protein n=1 Tax=Brucella melitensis TaxID=29459 RepID=UPI003B66C5D0
MNAISTVCVQEGYRRHHRTDNQSRAHKQHTQNTHTWKYDSSVVKYLSLLDERHLLEDGRRFILLNCAR